MNTGRRFQPCFDVLETRLAPATLVNPNTVIYRDQANQLVTVTISKPVFEAGTINDVFKFNQGTVNGNTNQLQRLDLLTLTDLPAQGATLTITTETRLTEIGRIDATSLDLAAIKVNGFVDEVDVGDVNLNTPALDLLKVATLGFFGNQQSGIQGDLNRIKISIDLFGFLDVSGSVESAVINNIIGIAAENSGRLRVGGDLGSLLVAQSIQGSSGARRVGLVEVGGDLGSATILGSVFGLHDDSGQITADGNIGTLIIGGDLNASASVGIGNSAARVSAGGNIGKVKIGGDVRGNDGTDSGSITADGAIQVVKVAGSVIGNDGLRSGRIAAQLTLGKVSIGGNLQADGDGSGQIAARQSIGEVFIGGSLLGNDAVFAGIAVNGEDLPTVPAIGSVTIAGDMLRARILAGYSINTFLPVDADQRIGKVKIGGDFDESVIASGIDPGGDGRFATSDDTTFDEPVSNEAPFARIDKIVIGGRVNGNFSRPDHFGIVAQEIGVVKIAGVPLALTAGPDNDVIELLPGGTNDVTVREV